MRSRVWLAAYVAFVLAVSFVHEPAILAAALALALGAAGRRAPDVARRALGAVALFAGVVIVAHAALVLQRGGDPWPWALRTFLRASSMTAAGLTLVRRVDVLSLAALHPLLRTVLAVALAQIATVRRVVRDARLALRSRSPRRPGLRLLTRHGGATAGALLRRTARETTVVTEAMTSRGAFLDADRS